MLFGEPQHHPKFDPETMFMEGPHGREYLRNRLKVEGHLHLPCADQDNNDKNVPLFRSEDPGTLACTPALARAELPRPLLLGPGRPRPSELPQM